MGDQHQAGAHQQLQQRRMSVQCAPVDFASLLAALKRTASIELPDQLYNYILRGASNASDPESSTTMKTTTSDDSSIINHNNTDIQSPTVEQAENLDDLKQRLILQTKLDLLHVSNSTVKTLFDNTFILENPIVRQRQNLNPVAPQERRLLVAIQSLHLARCSIEQIHSGAFNGLEFTLTSLSLNDNQLQYLPLGAIGRLVELKLLDLSNNKLLSLEANSFKTLNRLNTLRLADNRALGSRSAIDELAFAGLESTLNDLNLKNIQLEQFPRATIRHLHRLAFLNLAQNQISSIPSGSFELMSSLTAINLDRNRLVSVDKDTFNGAETSLSSLSLLGNLIEQLPQKQLEKLSVLRRLDLGFNRIEFLPPNSFEANKRLILIALDGNPLETLPEDAFKPLQGTLRGLSVGGKALNCDCRLSWMLRWQLDYNMQISSRERNPQFCSRPHYLRSLVSFAALKPEHLTCSPLITWSSSVPVTTIYSTSPSLSFDPVATTTVSTQTSVRTQSPTRNTPESSPTSPTFVQSSWQSLGSSTMSSVRNISEVTVSRVTDGNSEPAIITVAPIRTSSKAPSEASEEDGSTVEDEGTVSSPSSSEPDELGVENRTLKPERIESRQTSAGVHKEEASTNESTETSVDPKAQRGPEPNSSSLLASDWFSVAPFSASGQSVSTRLDHRHGYLGQDDLMRRTNRPNSTTTFRPSPINHRAGTSQILHPIDVRSTITATTITTKGPSSAEPTIYSSPAVFGDRQQTNSPLIATTTVASLASTPPTTTRAAESNQIPKETSPSGPVGARVDHNQQMRGPLVSGFTNSHYFRQQQQQQTTISASLADQQQTMPAVPTTINVYKTTGAGQSASNRSYVKVRNPPIGLLEASSLPKGPRFVEEPILELQSTLFSTRTTSSLSTTPTETSATLPQRTTNSDGRWHYTPRRTTLAKASSEFLQPSAVTPEFDPERFSQPSAPNPQLSRLPTPPPPSSSSTTTTSTTRPSSTTETMETTPAPTQFNTRMSVSSMYRLAHDLSAKPPTIGRHQTLPQASLSPTSAPITTTTATPAPQPRFVPESEQQTTSASAKTWPVESAKNAVVKETSTRMAATVRIVESQSSSRHPVIPTKASSQESSDGSSVSKVSSTTRPSVSNDEAKTFTLPFSTSSSQDGPTLTMSSETEQPVSPTGEPKAASSPSSNVAKNQSVNGSGGMASSVFVPTGVPQVTLLSKEPTTSSLGFSASTKDSDSNSQPAKPLNIDSRYSEIRSTQIDTSIGQQSTISVQNSSILDTLEDFNQPSRVKPSLAGLMTKKPIMKTPTTISTSLATSADGNDSGLDSSGARGSLFKLSKLYKFGAIANSLGQSDQMALLLAAFMCVCIFSFALAAIICTCCSASKSDSGSSNASSGDSKARLAAVISGSSSSAGGSPSSPVLNMSHSTSKDSYHNNQIGSSMLGASCKRGPTEREPLKRGLVNRLLLCFSSSSSGGGRKISPINSTLVMSRQTRSSSNEEDTTSSTSSSLAGLNGGPKSNGTSMLLQATRQNHRRESRPLFVGQRSMMLISRSKKARLGPMGCQTNTDHNGKVLGRARKPIKSNSLSHLQAREKKQHMSAFLATSTDCHHTLERKRAAKLEAGACGVIVGNKQHCNDGKERQMDTEGEYFLDTATQAVGRRATRWMSLIDIEPNRRRFADGEGGADWMSDSCDSDKSCSPGANRNNLYNIGEAHKAYLAGQQIQASRFVSTQEAVNNSTEDQHSHKQQQQRQTTSGSMGRRKASVGQNVGQCEPPGGLLKTTEFQTSYQLNAQQSQLEQWAEETEEEGTKYVQFADEQQHPIRGSSSTFAGHHLATQRTTTTASGLPAGTHTGFDLLPISAEEEWPEPYIEDGQSHDQAAALYEQEEQQQKRHLAPGQHYFDESVAFQDRQFEQYIETAPVSRQTPMASVTFSMPAQAEGRGTSMRQKGTSGDLYHFEQLQEKATLKSGAMSHQRRKSQPEALNSIGTHEHYFHNHTQEQKSSANLVAQTNIAMEIYNDSTGINPRQQASLRDDLQTRALTAERACDDAYLSNWRTISHGQRVVQGSLSGGANWLRWTPPISTIGTNQEKTR